MAQHHVPGYGVLATGNYDHLVNGGVVPCDCNETTNGDEAVVNEKNNILTHGDYYGSFDNASVSTTDSYNRWYDDFDGGAPLGQDSLEHQQSISFYRGSISSAYPTDYPTATDTSAPDLPLNYSSYGEETGGQASTSLVGWNILNLLLSTSLLAFPYIISKSGLILLPLLLLIVLLMNYTSRILVDMMYTQTSSYDGKKRRTHLDYVELTRDVLNSYRAAKFVQFIQLIEMLAICVLNIVILGRLTHEIINSVSIQLCTVIAALVALPTFFIKRLVVIGWLQTIGVFSLFIGLILIQGYCIVNYSKWDFASIPIYDLYELPTGIGVIIYMFGIHSILPGLEEQMKRPEKYGKTVNVTFFVAMFIQILFSITNAMFYGAKTEQVITIDLEDHFALGVTTACFIGISILSHFSLPTFVVMEKLDKAIHKLFPCCLPDQDQSSCAYTMLTIGIRLTVMVFSVSLAVLLPYFAYLMAFIGTAVTVLLSLLLPCIFHLKLYGFLLPKFQIFFDVFIIVFSIVAFFSGTLFSIYAMNRRDAT